MIALVLRGRIPQPRIHWRIALLAGGIGCLEVVGIHLHGPTGDRMTVMTSIIAYALSDAGVVLIFFSCLGANIQWSPLVYLGRISYGLYVFHLLWLDVAKVLLLHAFGTCPWWARAGIALPLTLACAAASYRWLETPFLRLKDKLSVVAKQSPQDDVAAETASGIR